jgi:outer membrane beta-barrel protein
MMKNALLFFVGCFLSGSILASEKSLYDFSWLDKDKEIYVLQNRRFRKDGRGYIGATGVKTLNGAFIDSYGGSFKAGYFFREDWGVEFVYGKSSGSTNDNYTGVNEQAAIAYYRKVDSYMGAMAMWSPFYSKINTFNKVFYFDWIFGAGLASINTLDNSKEFETPSDKSLTSESNMGLLWTTGMRFYITEHWSLRVDFMGMHYNAKKSSKKNSNQLETDLLFSNYDLGLGLNYSF